MNLKFISPKMKPSCLSLHTSFLYIQYNCLDIINRRFVLCITNSECGSHLGHCWDQRAFEACMKTKIMVPFPCIKLYFYGVLYPFKG